MIGRFGQKIKREGRKIFRPPYDLRDMNFDALFQEALDAHGWTRAQLAKLCGVSVRTLWNLKAGTHRKPHPKTIKGIAKALRLPEEKVRKAATSPTRR